MTPQRDASRPPEPRPPRPVLFEIPVSHFCEKARWALDYKGILYERRAVNPLTRRELAPHTPYRKTPVLLLPDGGTVEGSAAIAAWGEECGPGPPLMPRSEQERAACLEVQGLADERLGPATRRLFFWHAVRDPLGLDRTLMREGFGPRWLRPLSRPLVRPVLRRAVRRRFRLSDEDLPEARRAATEAVEALEKRRGGRLYFFEDRLTLADIAVASLALPLAGTPEFAGSPLMTWRREIARLHRPAMVDPLPVPGGRS